MFCYIYTNEFFLSAMPSFLMHGINHWSIPTPLSNFKKTEFKDKRNSGEFSVHRLMQYTQSKDDGYSAQKLFKKSIKNGT